MSLIWLTYYIYFALAVGCTVLTLLVLKFMSRVSSGSVSAKSWRRTLRGGLLSLVSASVLLLIVRGMIFPRQLLRAISAFRNVRGGVEAMPYTYQYTSEMMAIRKLPGFSPIALVKANASSLLNWLGGVLPCALAALTIPAGLIYRLLSRRGGLRRLDESPVCFAIEACFLGPWLLLGLYLAFSGMRFAELAVLPIGILCGLLVGRLWQLATRLARRRLLALLTCAGVCVCAAGPTCWGARNIGRMGSPVVNDGLREAMTFVREELPEDAALAAWWDFGYYMEYQARRRTLSDGGMSSAAMNWLTAKALLTDDPRLMANILRMLDAHGTDALDALEAQGMDQARAMTLLVRLLTLSRAEAGQALSDEGLGEALLELIHPARSNPLALMLGTDLIAKHAALAYFGFWNPETRAREGETSAIPSSESICPEAGEETEIPMTNGDYTLRLRRDERGGFTATYAQNDDTLRKPCRLCVWQDGGKLQDVRGEDDGLAVVIVVEGERCCALLCSENLCDSMLVRLLFCEDASVPGVEHLGDWYADSGEPCAAQRRIATRQVSGWATQLWRLPGAA